MENKRMEPSDSENSTNMPKEIHLDDEQMFKALLLAEEASQYVRDTLVYGADNRKANPRMNEAVPRVRQLRNEFDKLEYYRWDDKLGKKANVDRQLGFYGGLARIYQSGNCSEHAVLAYDYLCRKAPQGFFLSLIFDRSQDHGYVLIRPENKKENPIVCDPYMRGQACRLSESIYAKDVEMMKKHIMAEHTTTNEPFSIIAEAFSRVPPDDMRKVKPPDAVSKISKLRLAFHRSMGDMYSLPPRAPLAPEYHPSVEYVFEGKKVSDCIQDPEKKPLLSGLSRWDAGHAVWTKCPIEEQSKFGKVRDVRYRDGCLSFAHGVEREKKNSCFRLLRAGLAWERYRLPRTSVRAYNELRYAEDSGKKIAFQPLKSGTIDITWQEKGKPSLGNETRSQKDRSSIVGSR